MTAPFRVSLNRVASSSGLSLVVKLVRIDPVPRNRARPRAAFAAHWPTDHRPAGFEEPASSRSFSKSRSLS